METHYREGCGVPRRAEGKESPEEGAEESPEGVPAHRENHPPDDPELLCTGAGLVAWLLYAHREELATAVYGDMLKTRFCPCRILKRLFRQQA